MVQIRYIYFAVNIIKIAFIFLMSDKTSQNSLVYCVFFFPVFLILQVLHIRTVWKQKAAKHCLKMSQMRASCARAEMLTGVGTHPFQPFGLGAWWCGARVSFSCVLSQGWGFDVDRSFFLMSSFKECPREQQAWMKALGLVHSVLGAPLSL